MPRFLREILSSCFVTDVPLPMWNSFYSFLILLKIFCSVGGILSSRLAKDALLPTWVFATLFPGCFAFFVDYFSNLATDFLRPRLNLVKGVLLPM